MRKAYKYMQLQWEFTLELPRGIMDFGYYLRRERPPFSSFEAASYTSLQEQKEELKRLEEKFNEYLR